MLCPYCHTPLKGRLALPYLPQRQQIIYDAVVSAGREGITPIDLIMTIYAGRLPPPAASIILRVQVCELNKRIAYLHQRVRGPSRYRLTET